MRREEEKRGDGLEMDLLSKGGGIVLGGDEVERLETVGLGKPDTNKKAVIKAQEADYGAVRLY